MFGGCFVWGGDCERWESLFLGDLEEEDGEEGCACGVQENGGVVVIDKPINKKQKDNPINPKQPLQNKLQETRPQQIITKQINLPTTPILLPTKQPTKQPS